RLGRGGIVATEVAVGRGSNRRRLRVVEPVLVLHVRAHTAVTPVDDRLEAPARQVRVPLRRLYTVNGAVDPDRLQLIGDELIVRVVVRVRRRVFDGELDLGAALGVET